MDRAQTVDHCGCFDADHAARGKAVLKNAQGAPVVGVAEERNNDRAVADVEIRVAGRKAGLAIATKAMELAHPEIVRQFTRPRKAARPLLVK